MAQFGYLPNRSGNDATSDYASGENDGEGPALTATAGAPAAGNQNSITAGPRGPVLMRDRRLLGKLAHQNLERKSVALESLQWPDRCHCTGHEMGSPSGASIAWPTDQCNQRSHDRR